MTYPDIPPIQYPEQTNQCCQKCTGIVHSVKFQLPRDQAELDKFMRYQKYHNALTDLQKWIRSIENTDEITVESLKAQFAEIIDQNGAYL